MRFVLALGLVAVGAASTAAHAGPGASDRLGDAAERFRNTLVSGKARAIVRQLGPALEVSDLTFDDAACKREFGERTPRTIAKRRYKQLAECLRGAPWRWSVTDRVDRIPDSTDAFELSDGAGTRLVVTVAGAEARLRVVGLRLVVPVATDSVIGTEPSPPLVPETLIIAPTVLDRLRTGGDTKILPTDADRAAIDASGKVRLMAIFKLCLLETGIIRSVTRIKSTGFPGYDATLLDTIKRTWTFHPYEVGGTAREACSSVMFSYARK